MITDFDFSGRTALITGGATGMGAATARWLDARGIERLIIVDRNAEAMSALGLRCKVEEIVGDVADPALWNKLESAGAPLDHALINAGISIGGKLVDLDFADWRKVMAVNLDGAFLGLRHALRRMREARKGSVVLTASIGGIKAVPNIGAYCPAKAAVIHMARVAALEMAEYGVRVNAIAPGKVDTPIWDTTPAFQARVAALGSREAATAEMSRQTAGLLQAFASAEELAAHIGFLLSDMAANITGTALVSDGGSTL